MISLGYQDKVRQQLQKETVDTLANTLFDAVFKKLSGESSVVEISFKSGAGGYLTI